MIHLDTTLLVDVLREAARGLTGGGTRFLESAAGDELGVSVHVVCELEAGVESATRPVVERQRVRSLVNGLHVVYPDQRFPETYGRLLAWLEARGQRIPTMDLLIATAAVVGDAPLVSRNSKDFGRVPGLRLLSY